MNTFTLDDLKTLALKRAGPCVSIFLPTHRSAVETHGDRVRFKQLLRAAEEQLVAGGMRSPAAKSILEPVHRLAEDPAFWRQPGDGMAVFAADDLFRVFHLPLALEESVAVAPRFHVKPLLPLLRDDGRFYVLALSQNAVRLLVGSHFGINEVTPEHMPQGLAEALQSDEVEKSHQFHTISSPGAGGPFAMFHGHGEGHDDSKDRITRYFQQVNHGIHRMLHIENVPLVLAGVQYLQPMYRDVNTYTHLLPEGITGNPDDRTAAELHAAAWALVEPRFARARNDAVDAYHRWSGTARASNHLEAVVPAAYQGRVETLLVAAGVQRWGQYDPDADRLDVHAVPGPGDDDLLDFAAIKTLLTGGRVYSMPTDAMAEDSPLAAVFRY
ncbi:MAG: hypothetical protein HZB53_01555 [Chloroflexi bacterium]|nr:hypothetical protein [Chloroflexota bacterium]